MTGGARCRLACIAAPDPPRAPPPMSEQVYSLKRVQETLGLSRAVVIGLVSAGFVVPGRGPRNEYRFSFRDLMLLRTAHALREARVPTRRILRSLGRLRARLPAELPLTGLRITAVGADVAVRDRSGTWHAESGQSLMDFEVAADAGRVAILPRREPTPGAAPPPPQSATATTPDALFEWGRSLEGSDPGAAENVYRQVLLVAPAHVRAYLDLGALLCEQGRSADAAALYERALVRLSAEPLIHFNRAVALEDQQRHDAALASYERALALDPQLADAHFNAGRLSEQQGDAQRALRHFSAYRRLQAVPK